MQGIILAVLLGWAGGYRFYKKQYGLGFLYFFTGGIGGIGWIIDIIIAIKEYIHPAPVKTEEIVPRPSYLTISRTLYTEEPHRYATNIANQKHYIVYDFETTGVDPHYCEIIEIGALKISDGQIVDSFQSFVKPFYPIPADAIEIHNITNEMVQDAPTAEQIIPSFIDFLGDSKLVGYNNARFDHIILKRYAMAICNVQINNSISDVYSLCRKKIDLKRYRLSDVAAYFKIQPSNIHRSLGDCETTWECFKKLQDIYKKEIADKKAQKNET